MSGAKMQQLHDLGDARSCHPAGASQFRIILNRFVPQHSLKSDSKCHEPGDPRNVALPHQFRMLCRDRRWHVKEHRNLRGCAAILPDQHESICSLCAVDAQFAGSQFAHGQSAMNSLLGDVLRQ